MRKSKSLPLFLLAGIVAFIVVLVGLRLYFDQQRLNDRLTYSIDGGHFSSTIGLSKKAANNTLRVTKSSDKNSSITIENINIQANLYETLSVKFGAKPSQQSLLLHVGTKSHGTSEYEILYSNKDDVSQFFITDLVTKNAVIDSFTLSTEKLIDNYTLDAVVLKPKKINNLRFIYLFGSDVSQIFSPANSQTYFLLPAYQLVLLYLACVVIIYFLLLTWTRQQKLLSWWLPLVTSWLVLDVIYSYQFGFTQSVEVSATHYQGWFTAIFSLSPWALGSAISLICLKRRYAYLPLAIGCGYLIGAVLTAFCLKVAEVYQWQLNWFIIWFLEWGLAISLLYFFRPKRCSVEELRLEKAPTNIEYIFSLLLILAAIFHIFMITDQLLVTWSDWLGKNADVSNKTMTWWVVYWQQTSGEAAGLAAIGLAFFVAMGLLIFGGLRYLGMTLLPAMFACYAVLSLPLWHQYAVLIGYSYDELYTMIAYLAILIFTAVLFCYREYRVLLLLIFLLIIFMMGFNGSSFSLLDKMIAEPAMKNDTYVLFVNTDWFAEIFNRCYLLLPAVLGSLIIWVVVRQRSAENQGINIIFVLAVVTLLLFLAIMYSILNTGKAADFAWLDNTLAMIVTIMALIPVCVYSLVTKDDETLPVI